MSLISENIVKLKQAFVKSYSGKSHIQEILPKQKTGFLPIDENHLALLHQFMENNPIYHDSIDAEKFTESLLQASIVLNWPRLLIFPSELTFLEALLARTSESP